MVEKVLAGLGLLICLILGLRMLLGDQRTRRFDARFAAKAQQARRSLKALPQWRQTRDAAHREAAAAIERAKRKQVQRDGNVIRPRFGGDKKDD